MITANKQDCFVDMAGYPETQPEVFRPLRIATARARLRVAQDQLDALSNRLAADDIDARTISQAQRDLDQAAIKIVKRRHELSLASA